MLFFYGPGRETIARELLGLGCIPTVRLRPFTTAREVERRYMHPDTFDGYLRQHRFAWKRECNGIKQGICVSIYDKITEKDGTLYFMTLPDEDVAITHRDIKSNKLDRETDWIFVSRSGEIDPHHIATSALEEHTSREALEAFIINRVNILEITGAPS